MSFNALKIVEKLLFGLYTLLTFSAFGNDGAFYASGNQLIPMNETEISVKKEILKITRINENEVKIVVYYEFMNPGDGKEIIVGFEAPSPQGDVDGYPKDGKHPYIRDFTVLMNGENLNYKTAIVTDSNYFNSGRIQSKSLNDVIDKNFDVNNPDFYYVNYFDAKFEKGLNKIKHEYIFRLAESVMVDYSLDYILTAANRWANKQIDDFTLIVDLGDYTDFNIERTFFSGFEGWSGANKLMDVKGSPYEEIGVNPMRVFTDDKPIVFRRLNFRPKGELSIYSTPDFSWNSVKEFNYKKHLLPYDLKDFGYIMDAADEDSFKVLRNYPFARRGYVFKTEMIQNYYESLDWYVPNKEYSANIEELTDQEKKWLNEIKANH